MCHTHMCFCVCIRVCIYIYKSIYTCVCMYVCVIRICRKRLQMRRNRHTTRAQRRRKPKITTHQGSMPQLIRQHTSSRGARACFGCIYYTHVLTYVYMYMRIILYICIYVFIFICIDIYK